MKYFTPEHYLENIIKYVFWPLLWKKWNDFTGSLFQSTKCYSQCWKSQWKLMQMTFSYHFTCPASSVTHPAVIMLAGQVQSTRHDYFLFIPSFCFLTSLSFEKTRLSGLLSANFGKLISVFRYLHIFDHWTICGVSVDSPQTTSESTDVTWKLVMNTVTLIQFVFPLTELFLLFPSGLSPVSSRLCKFMK